MAQVDPHPAYKAIPPVSAPDSTYMSKAGWDTLFALIDGALPAIQTSSNRLDSKAGLVVSEKEFERVLSRTAETLQDGPSREALSEYLRSRPIDDEEFQDDCRKTLGVAPQRFEMAKVMNFVSKRTGSLLLTGHWKPPAQQPVHVREAIIKSWYASKLTPLRMMAKSITIMAQKANATSSPYLNKMTQYTDIPRGWEPQTGYDFKFIQLEPGHTTHEITTDVVIVGSGCGGAVCAKNLATAGHKVLLVEKGYHFQPNSFPMNQNAAIKYLYDNNGMFLSDTSSTNILAGSTWGGGGTINWSVSLKLQDYVREEWAATGLPLFTSPEYDECIDRVWKAIGASQDAIRHNHGNRVVLEGSQKLGWRSKAIDQNTSSKEHYCGQCHLGCGMNEKRGPTLAWLPAAAEAGAEFMEGLEVHKVLFDKDGKTAIGVQGTWTARDAEGNVSTDEKNCQKRKVIIKAKKVIVSSGTIQSPVLLARSGITNPQLGRNLYLHPCNMLTAVFNDDERGWEGGIITSYCGEFENLDRKGHGVKLETLCMVPYTAMAMQAWGGGLDCKLLLPKYRHLRGFIGIVRDRDTGRVYPDPRTGKPRIDYDVSPFDAEHAMDGLEAITKLCYVMGATEIRPHLPGVTPFVVDRDGDPKLQAAHAQGKDPEFSDPAFGKWLKQMRKVGNKPPVANWTSAHQMGTCRMSAKESDGVVDSKGKVWGHNNLYVADASVFPSASGVNPMVTVMSIADYISRGVAKDLSG